MKGMRNVSVDNTITGQDEYIWDTEQIRGSKDEITKASDILNEAESRLQALQTRLSAVWDSSEASVEFQNRLSTLLKDIHICSENLSGFAGVLGEVSELYDETENSLCAQFGALEEEIKPIESIEETV